MDYGTMSNVLEITRDGSHTAVTLNRPDKANALAAPLVAALQSAIDNAKIDGTTTFTLQQQGAGAITGLVTYSGVTAIFSPVESVTRLQTTP